MQYLTENLALNGVDLRRIYRWYSDFMEIDPMDYFLMVVGCSSTWPGGPATPEYLRPEQVYNTSATYNIRITGFNLVNPDQTMADLQRYTKTIKYVKYADGNYTIEEGTTGV